MIALLIFLVLFINVLSLRKVIIPSVYKEWGDLPPNWATDESIQSQYQYSLFLYQKLYPDKPNYIALNRGTEGAVYLRYIVDHYFDLPDVMVFVHGYPEDHQPNWLSMVGCVSENVSYISINTVESCKDTSFWRNSEIWVEQCWRDVLRTIWGIGPTMDDTLELNKLLPVDRPILVCSMCCQQFIVSKAMILKRPIQIWKKLLKIIGEQTVCHIGEPDYNNLYAFRKHHQMVGPEQPNIASEGESAAHPGVGFHTQGGAMEHLAHVIFGFQDLDSFQQDNAFYCENFKSRSVCPGSPCHD